MKHAFRATALAAAFAACAFAGPAAFAATSKLQIQVYDIEVMQSVRSGNWDALLSGGLRLAQLPAGAARQQCRG